MQLIIGGALGRMGRELTLAAESAGVTVACGVDVAYAGQPMPYAMVSGYEKLEETTGRRASPRAVGNAVGRNPVAIMIQGRFRGENSRVTYLAPGY